ncbi:GntR family transcriptional regulator [Jiangella sp. DSM 45060]|uniref:GntR family transcriptional regulator n=1 Tax=Jiangella sp. DSM 45060 TaxID=1798224 RepID=UPI00087D7EDF|nr:GntR family transcriptional regulator [Jiangella sp. DSM 45060]SDT48764.1 transcriptional regulator, GntR family [Jiangella sp. DSM 45060]
MSREAGQNRKYRQIADDLRAAIDDGTHGPGDRLPGENALMSAYGVARMTARQALAVLQQEGLAVARKGSGVFVREFRPIVRSGIARLSKETWGSGGGIWDAESEQRTLTVDNVTVTEEEAGGHVAVTLGLDDGDTVLVRRRRYLLDGRPVMVATSSFPAELARGTAIARDDTGPGGVYARLSELGHDPVRFTEDVRARMPRAVDAGLLDVDAGAPLFVIVRVAFTAGRRAVEVNEMTLDASAYVLRYEFDA